MGHKPKRRYTRPAEWEIEEFEAFLGPELARQHTKAELAGLYRDMHDLADILLTLWIEKREAKKDPNGFES